jgi:hypothetical protein
MLAGNQLVRTRADYAKAGFLTAVPDIAGDFKDGARGVASGYRWSAGHAADLGALIAHLRGLKAPVYLVGTSRAALSVSNAAVRLEGPQRPDAIVITSGMLMDQGLRQPSAEQSVGHLERIAVPVLLVVNADDACRVSPPDGAPAFRRLLTAAPKTDLVTLKGGSAGPRGQECEGNSYHGFLGLDAEVVRTVTDWLKALPHKRRAAPLCGAPGSVVQCSRDQLSGAPAAIQAPICWRSSSVMPVALPGGIVSVRTAC